MSANSDKLVVKNRILSALPAEEYKRLLPNLKPVGLEYKQVIYQPNKPIRYVYFPNDGVICLMSTVMGRTEVAWLRSVQVTADGSLEGFDEIETQVNPDEIFEGCVVLAAHLLGLLLGRSMLARAEVERLESELQSVNDHGDKRRFRVKRMRLKNRLRLFL